MPPFKAGKATGTARDRFTSGQNAGSHIWDVSLQTTNQVVIYPDTEIVCGCCFMAINDISQHVNKASGCANYLGAQYCCYLCQENGDNGMDGLIDTDDEAEVFRPRMDVIACMLNDDSCPVNARDIIQQDKKWSPLTNFQNNQKHGHTVSNELTENSFKYFYDQYLDKNEHLKVCQVPDIVSKAMKRASSVLKYPRFLKNFYDWSIKKSVEKRIQRKVEAGELIEIDPEYPYELFEEYIDKQVVDGNLLRLTVPRSQIQAYVSNEIQYGRLQVAGGQPPVVMNTDTVDDFAKAWELADEDIRIKFAQCVEQIKLNEQGEQANGHNGHANGDGKNGDGKNGDGKNGKQNGHKPNGHKPNGGRLTRAELKKQAVN